MCTAKTTQNTIQEQTDGNLSRHQAPCPGGRCAIRGKSLRFAIWGVALKASDPSRVIRARVRRFNGTVRSSVRCFDYSTAPNRFHQVSVTCLAVVFPSGKELEKQLGERAKCDF